MGREVYKDRGATPSVGKRCKRGWASSPRSCARKLLIRMRLRFCGTSRGRYSPREVQSVLAETLASKSAEDRAALATRLEDFAENGLPPRKGGGIRTSATRDRWAGLSSCT